MGKHPESFLAQGPPEKFTSRYADPNHPASSGNLISFITGGHINPPSLGGGGFGGGFGSRENGYGSARTGYGGGYSNGYQNNAIQGQEQPMDPRSRAIAQRGAMRQQGGYRGGFGPGTIIEMGKHGVGKMLGKVSFSSLVMLYWILTCLNRMFFTL